MRMNAKKVIVLHVLKILQEESSKETPITQIQIANKLSAMGIHCDRKTVGRNIECLIHFGYHIIKLTAGGCYLEK